MRAIKKINNNVAVCIDSDNTELVAFGKGIGFPSMPYEITDLSQIFMTFYRIENQFYKVLKEIPENVFEVSALIVHEAMSKLNCNLNPNLVVSLADHINFAMLRMKKFKEMKILFAYDVQHLYPIETEIGKFAVDLIQKKLLVTLPESEITTIAMHFVNAEEESIDDKDTQQMIDLVDKVTALVEKTFAMKIDRKSYNYNRFVMHMRYHIQRILNKTQFSEDNAALIQSMKQTHPEVYEIALKGGGMISGALHSDVTESELLYLMIHIARIINNNDSV
jgi:beta-glucoside operon transcriptional antiterminator